ncbi:hypothetical protein [Streptosporangium lutulentum]|uniref:Septal ring factor EnvC (AmiA/AmiB activator) n=1 Tax=Streptosporangium lutulentum TaxID=1461250 RepID=A0ABT9QCN2_9ACTN|nr:hypothetical protein [Streptosporangium lutulentum]MDP9844486.1 septal ring factor EnvC (AmiA/AmiB activator) [Streptosporangium lutulentum]
MPESRLKGEGGFGSESGYLALPRGGRPVTRFGRDEGVAGDRARYRGEGFRGRSGTARARGAEGAGQRAARPSGNARGFLEARIPAGT